MRKWSFGLRTALAAAMMASLPVAQAFAQEAAAETQKEVMDIGTWLKYGGTVGYVILLVSVVMVALMIEHLVNIRRDKLVPPETIDELEALLEEEEYQEALEYCETEPNYLTNVIGAALPKMNAGFEEMRDAAASAAAVEVGKLNQKISYINLIANMGPMLGLFGTVVGMVAAFTEIVNLGPAVTPKDLASGVQQALITTVDGLLVAMPAIAFGFYIKNRVIQITTELNAVAEEMLERFRPQHQA